MSTRFRPRRVHLRDGSEVMLREIDASDADEIVQAFQRLSTTSRYMRFMQRKKQLGSSALERGVRPRSGLDFALVATIRAADGLVPMAATLGGPNIRCAPERYLARRDPALFPKARAMDFKDYYKVLGVERTAGDDDIKKAFRRLARKHHPDISKAPEAAARMQELNEAYEVLRDKEKRAAYDRVGQGAQAGQAFHPPPGWESGFEFSGGPDAFGDAGDHSAFFEALFGAARRGAHGRPGHGSEGVRARRGQDHHAKIVVPLEDAFKGATRELTLHSPEMDAAGRVTLRERTLQVAIPKGIRAGQLIRLAGQGSPGLGDGPRGDLYLEVEFAPHPRWRVDGRDVYFTLRVAPWEAALGAAVKVPTPDGTVEMSVPAGSQTGRKLRLRGRGIPGSPHGDLYVLLEVVLPPASDDKARALYRQMAQDLAFDPRPHVGADA